MGVKNCGASTSDSGKKLNSERKPTRSKPVDLGGHIGSIHLLEDGAPPYELRIDREGRWFHEGVEIVREDIRNLFSRHLARQHDGSYCVRIGRDEAPVIVEDAPFVVVRVMSDARDSLTLLLSDGSVEPLDGRTLTFRNPNVPYCRVRNNLDARFSRPAYYQLAEFIGYNEVGDGFFLKAGDQIVELEAP